MCAAAALTCASSAPLRCAPQAPTPEKKKKSESSADKKDESSFQFGWINVVLIFGLGAIVCIKMGLFDGESTPRPPRFIAPRATAPRAFTRRLADV